MTSAAQQTRLDRLITLLDTGSTPGIRATAARQLGQIASVRVRGGSSGAPSAAVKPSSNVKAEEDEDAAAAAAVQSSEAADSKPSSSAKKWGNAGTRFPKERSAPQLGVNEGASTYRGTTGDWDQALLLLARVLPHLRSKSWDTRVAAATAIESICSACGVWDPDAANGGAAKTPADDVKPAITTDLLSFETFSLATVLKSGTKLLSSAGAEYDQGPVTGTVAERLAHAKRDMARLGLGGMAGEELMDIGVDVEKELMGGAENGNALPPPRFAPQPPGSSLPAPRLGVAAAAASTPASASSTSSPTAPTISLPSVKTASPSPGLTSTPADDDIDMSKLSARERNQLKRKRKMEGKTGGPAVADKTRVVSGDAATSSSSPAGIRIKAPSGSNAGETPQTPTEATHAGNGTTTPGAAASATTSLLAPAQSWPFTHLCALLLADLFSPKWEVRHGAALAIRSLFSTQGSGGGKMCGVDDNEARRAAWSEDAAIRLLTVLALDRLGDFVFDQVVAPIRESAAQCLAALLKHMTVEGARRVEATLVQMIRQEHVGGEGEPSDRTGKLATGRHCKGYAWEVRHAGFLGLRWFVEVRRDLLDAELLSQVVDTSVLCLRDDDDDVRAVAAATLLPIADHIVSTLPAAVDGILTQLWECLSDLKDDLSSSTAGVMDLLATLVGNASVTSRLDAARVTHLIPRLLPFFRHTITSVRLAVLNALNTFLGVEGLTREWIDDRLLRLLFQNLIVEERIAIRDATRKAWSEVVGALSAERLRTSLSPHLATFHTILMTPLGSAFDSSLFYRATATATATAHSIDKGMLAQDLSLVGVDTVIRARLGAAQALGSVAGGVGIEELLRKSLKSASSLERCLAAVVIQERAHSSSSSDASFAPLLHAIVEAPPPATYSEMTFLLHRLLSESRGLYAAVSSEAKVAKAKVPTLPTTVDTLGKDKDAFTLDTAKHVAGPGFEALLAQSSSAKARKAAEASLEERRRRLIGSIGLYQATKAKQDTQVLASVAAAIVALGLLPAKLNPVIRSIMNSVKFEENADLQRRSAAAVAALIELCSRPDAKANPSDKIVKNLCAFVCQDTTMTAVFAALKDDGEGILSLNAAKTARTDDASESDEVREGKLIRRGAEAALSDICQRLGANLFDVLPSLWVTVAGPLEALDDSFTVADDRGQSLLDSCSLLRIIAPCVNESLHGRLAGLLPALTKALQDRRASVRNAAALALATLADVMTETVMLHVVEHAVPLLGDSQDVPRRQGAIECLSVIAATLDIKVLPYVIVLVVPILGRMSDSDDAVRLAATSTFAALIKMVPLEAGLPDPPGFSAELMARREKERSFLSQLLDGSKVEPYSIPVKINAELRPYQLDGVSWMAFLAKFQLHGVLCDDMGLGKTLQSICILSSSHHERAERHAATKAPDSAPLPSLVICPPTLTAHWVHEIKQYANNLRPLLYVGQPQERAKLQREFGNYDVVVMSYDSARSDVASLSPLVWNYCILDEGHIIKNAKTKTTKAVKMLRSNHRLLLSGTPIQNNVLELWSLFDFLMPGFLGNERSFHERFGKPILASRDGKVSAKEHEAAALALDALHKQVLPFLLRRLKEDVLDDLPPKIIQDIECDLGSVQKELYDDFSRRQDRSAIEGAIEGDADKGHVFQTLQYLRKLVNHPSLVFEPTKNAKHAEIEKRLAAKGSSVNDVSNAPKLQALRQLLQDCGVGGGETEANETNAAVSQHRVLIFCQLRQMLDLIERDLFKAHMPDVSYMRLDGGVPADRRHSIVQTFNSDPSIDVLLLTTSVGGLGLTLTGADTVIFVEHDWNPQKDLQAMDRAHRLGQKKVVNVYRLITRNTLEARIMGLQRFKLNIANSVVTQQNAGLDTMATDQILDLFDVEGAGASDAAAKQGEAKGGISQKALLESLEGMPDTGDDYADMKEWKA